MSCIRCSSEFCWSCTGFYVGYKHESDIAAKECFHTQNVKTLIAIMVISMTICTVSNKFNIAIGSLLREFYDSILQTSNLLLSMRVVSFVQELIVQEAVLLSAFLQTNYLIVGFRISLQGILGGRLLNRGALFRFVCLVLFSPSCSIMGEIGRAHV